MSLWGDLVLSEPRARVDHVKLTFSSAMPTMTS